MISVASFDVFETVLVRRLGSPSGLFLMLGRRLANEWKLRPSPEIFARARLEAERRARRRIGPALDPTLADIYRELADALHWSGDERDVAMELELELEASVLTPSPIGTRMVDQARRLGRRVVFTSDTYFSAPFLRAQLKRHGIITEDDLLVVSCERRATKRAGTLFPALSAELGVSVSKIVHVGNDSVADDRAARAAGLRVTLLPEGNLTADEQALDDQLWATGGLSSVLAGAARVGRIQMTQHDDARRDLEVPAADIAAPALIGYALWILRTAQRRGLRTLFFLSREGQVLLDVARVLRDATGLDIDLRYLYVSRQSVNLAALEEPTRPELAWALTHAETNTLRTLLSRLRLHPEDLAPELDVLGLTTDDWDRVPDAGERARVLDALIQGELRPHLVRAVSEAREVATAYLRQEGFLGPAPCGIVDASGVGSQFKSLYRLRELAGVGEPAGFLFVRSHDPYLAAEGGYLDARAPTIDVYLEDQVARLGCGTFPGLPQLLEMFCAADHGTALSYQRSGNRVESVLASDDAPHLEAWGLSYVRRTMLDVTRALWLDERYVDLDGDLRPAVRGVLQRFWSEPTLAEACAWGSYPIEATSGGGDTATPLAAAYTASEVGRAVLRGAVRDRAWFSWRDASNRLTPLPLRAVLASARTTKRAGAKLGRVVR